MTVNSAPMSVSSAMGNGAPRNLGALAATATRRGWGAMVERDETRDAWTLVIATPSDSRTGRYTWRAGKWATGGRGYRETAAWYRSATDGAPGAEAAAEAADTAPAAEADAPSTAAQASALDTLRDASRKITDAVADARKAASDAEGCHAEAYEAQEAADAARTTNEAEEWAEEAQEAAGRAAECVKRAKAALRRAKAQRTVILAAARAVEELGLDHTYRRDAEENEATARELLGDAEEAAEEAQNGAEAARGAADRICPMCECFIRRAVCDGHASSTRCARCAAGECGCRAVMLAALDRAGSTVARTVDAEAVRVGYLLDSDDVARVDAGQLMLAGEWGAAEDALAEAEEGPAEAEERRAVVRAAEAATEAERSAARPAEREAAQRAAECAEAAAEAETHSARAAEAYEYTRDLMMHTISAWAARPVDLLPEAEAAEARALLRLLDRRSRVAHDVDCAARWDWYDGAPVTDPQRARDCANRARVLADGCEADARRVVELFAWGEYAQREAEAEEERRAVVRAAEWELARAEERARHQSGYPSAQARRIGEGNARRAVQNARCALAAVNGRPFVARAEISSAGHDQRWSVVDASRGRRIIASGFGCMAEAESDAERRNEERAAEDAEAAAAVRQARRRVEEAEGKAEEARRRAERLDAAAEAHYGRFAGGQPILMGHHSARGALRDRARGDAATRRAIEAAAEADRSEGAARKARQTAELAETVHGRSRPWERADFQRGDVVEVRKIYADTYVVVRANAKTLTLRNAHTIDDVKARYDQVLSRTRGGETLTDPGKADAPSAEGPGLSQELDEDASKWHATSGGRGGFTRELDADASKATAPARPSDVISDPGAVDAWEGEGGAAPGVETPAAECWLPADEETGAPAQWASDRTRYYVQWYRARDYVPTLGWAAAHVRVMEAAEAGRLRMMTGDRFVILTETGRARPVKAERVQALYGGGFLTRGKVRGTGESRWAVLVPSHAGREALALCDLWPMSVHPTERDAYAARRANVAGRSWMSSDGRKEWARRLRVPDGMMYAPRTAAPGPEERPTPPPGVTAPTSTLTDVVSDPSGPEAWEGEGGAVPGVETPAAAPADELAAVVREDVAQEEAEDAAALDAAAGHPVFVECEAAAELLTAHADEHPDDEQAEGWAFEAVERVAACALAIEDGDEERAHECARAAKGERAALTLGRLDEAGPMTPERLAALDADTLDLLRWYAGPWPVRWLWPPEEDEAGRVIRPRVINLFHGPGGWSVGIRDVLGADVDMVGVDLDPGAVATAEAAGFEMIRASVTDLDPECPALQWVSGIILSPPCQAFSPAGLRMGRYASAIELIVSVVRGVGAAAGFLALVDAEGRDAGNAPHSGESWDDVRAPLAALEDPRAGLMAEVTIWPLAMLARGGSVEWVAVEQSSALPTEIERALIGEFVQAGWGTVEAETLDAVDYGAASHRKRRFLTAHRTRSPFVDVRPAAPFPVVTFAECAGWERGRRVNTRGQRGIDPRTGRPKGGNQFSADKPSPCITATAYGWKDDETGERLEQTTIGRLVGFPGAYPWQHVGRGVGIRNRAQQAADAVCPMVSAAVIGRALGVEEWETRARAYADALYRPDVRRDVPLTAVVLPRPRPAVEAAAGGPAPAAASAVPSTGGTAAVPAAVGGTAPAAGAPVPCPLSRRAQTGGFAGVRAGHSTRQGATRQGTRQATRQPAGAGFGSRGPPCRAGTGPAGNAVRQSGGLTGAHQDETRPPLDQGPATSPNLTGTRANCTYGGSARPNQSPPAARTPAAHTPCGSRTLARCRTETSSPNPSVR